MEARVLLDEGDHDPWTLRTCVGCGRIYSGALPYRLYAGETRIGDVCTDCNPDPRARAVDAFIQLRRAERNH
jgi:hypothetical protein